MKKLFVLGLVLLASAVSAQSFVVSPFAGYSSMQTFGYYEYMETNVGTELIGLESGRVFWDKLEFGLEFVYPFGYEFKDSFGELTYKNMQIGAYGKYYFNVNYFKPFLKTSWAYYWGDCTFKPINPNLMHSAGDYKVDSNWGINVGGGILLNLGLFAEFDYHWLTRHQYGCEDDFNMNSWDVRGGYQFSFGH